MCKSVAGGICVFTLLVVVASSALADINDGLVAYFKLDETSGTFAADSSGNGNHGTLVGTQAQWVPGYFDGGVEFATAEDEAHVEFPTTGMSATAGTISVWGNLREPQAARTRYFFGHTTRPPYSDRIQIYMDGGTTDLDIGLGGTHGARTNVMTLPTGVWTHVVLTWDNGTYVVYVNGANLATGSYSGLTALDPVANISDDSNPSESEAFDGILDEARIYNRAITAEEVTEIYEMLPPSRTKAQDPSPADKAVDVTVDAALGWTANEFAATHDVYLGTVFADVNDASRTGPGSVLVSQDQAATTYDAEGLFEYGQTYYWRIDEVNAAPDNTVFKGDVWSFTVEPFAYPITGAITTTASSFQPNMGPQNTVNGSGLNADDQHSVEATHMWMTNGSQPAWIQFEFDKAYKLDRMLVWNSNQMVESMIGLGAKDVTIEYSTDGATWATLEGVPEFAQATGMPTYAANTIVPFGGVVAQYVKLTINANWGGVAPQTGLAEVQFFQIPVQAREPVPADGATDVSLDAELNWRPGREATSHEVRFGTDSAAVTDGTVAAQTVTEHSYMPAGMIFGTTYYWKVDEVGDAGTCEGDLWSFTAQEYAPIDDMESYNDDDHRIYESWIDGVTTGASGSIVGYMEAPFAEKTIVHGGKQSMPLEYDNSKTPFISEAEQEFGSPQNWTVDGADTLSLWVHGNPAAFVEDAGTITMSAGGHDIWDNADDFRFAYKSLNGDGSVVVKVESLVNTNAWAKAGVMIRQSLDADSKFVYFIQSFSSGVSMGWRLLTAGACDSATQADITAPQWVKLTRKGDVFTAQYSADGTTWTDLKAADGTVASTTLAMTNPVYIGLCVTSHDAAATTTAVMSGAATTGNITGGAWQVQAIGDDPQPANDSADLYVTVEDSSGKQATATNAMAVTSADWTQWQIPLSDLAGVNMAKVQKLTIGVDSRTSSTKGAGMIYIDDIGYGHPAQ